LIQDNGDRILNGDWQTIDVPAINGLIFLTWNIETQSDGMLILEACTSTDE